MGGTDALQHGGDIVLFNLRVGLPRSWGGQFRKGNHFLLYVFGNIDGHRTWSTRESDLKRFWHYLDQLFDRANQPVVLGNGEHQTVGVNFLESIGADHRSRNLARYGHQGNRVHLCVGHRGYQVGGTGAGASETDLGLAAGARHTQGDESGTLLVPGQDVADGGIGQCVIDWQVGTARYAGNG